ncbi:hypothetical protein L218DRAFT_1004989 [Marasmius fiardii PR-910]|nr:hypothetical protein L218DRAFT_1004989 [Marasmius fiardii PR-910]
MKERRRQDPWLLEEVMEQVEVTPSSSSKSGSKQKVQFEEPSRGLVPPISSAASASEAAKIWAENPNIKFEDEETMIVKSTIDGHDTHIRGLQASMAQYNFRLEQTKQKMVNSFAEVKAMIIQSRARPTPSSEPSQSFAQSAGSRLTNSLSRTGSAPPARTGGICYMCNGQGHILTECDWQKEYIKRGWIKIDPKSGRWVLKDGTPMPYQKEGDPDPRYSKIERIAREANWDGASEAGGSDPSSVMYLTEEPPTESFYQGNSPEALSNDTVLGNEDTDVVPAHKNNLILFISYSILVRLGIN